MMLKKLIALLLVLGLVFGCAACGGEDAGGTAGNNDPGTSGDPGASNDPGASAGGGGSDDAPAIGTENVETGEGVITDESPIGDTLYITPGSVERTTPANTLTYGSTASADNFNTVTCTQDGSFLVYDTLFYEDQMTGEYLPLLVEEYTWVDNLTLEVKLIEGVKFTNGAELTAEDVLYTFERHFTENSLFTSTYSCIDWEATHAVDDYNIVFIFATEYYNGVGLFANANASIVNKEWCQTATDDDWWSNPNGTGPYTVVENINGDHLTLQVKEDWWGFEHGLTVPADTVIHKYYNEQTTMLIDYANGNLDVLFDLNTTSTEQLMQGYVESSTLYARANATFVIYLPVQGLYGEACFSDKNFRLAFAHALDLEAIAYAALGDMSMPSNSFSAGGATQWQYDVPNYEYNTELALDYLSKSAYPDGYEMTLYLVSDPSTSAMAEAMQAYLSVINIDLEIQELDISSAVSHYIAGDSAFMIKRVSSIDPSSYYERSDDNASGNPMLWVGNAEMTEHLNTLRQSSDYEKRYAAMCEVYDYFYEECIMINIADGFASYAYRDWVDFCSIRVPGTSRTVRQITMK